MKELDWEILKVLYEKSSITKTAEVLYISQPALTKRIKVIEREWGIEVVKRSSRGVTFTEDGRYLVQKAITMCDFLQEIRDHFAKSSSKKDLLRIGVPNSFARTHMPKLLKNYKDQYNSVIIQTVPNTSDTLIHLLTDGTLDATLICGDYSTLGDKVCLLDEQLFVVAPKGTRMDDIVNMPLIQSQLNPMVQLIVDQWWKGQFGNLPQGIQKVPYSDIALEMVKNGLGISMLFNGTKEIEEDEIEFIPVYDRNGNPVSRKVWLMWNENCYRSKDITEFILFVQEYYRNI